MGIGAATGKALATRKGMAAAFVAALFLLFVVLWFFFPDTIDSLKEYLNEHGGYAALFLVLAAVLSWIAMWIQKQITPLNIGLAFVITVLALVAFIVPMAI